MIRLLLCGSSHRARGAGGWTLQDPIAALLRVLQPDLVAHGASPSGGLDALADTVARAHFSERGLTHDEHVRPYPMRRDLDGEGGAAFMQRNARMGTDFFAGISPDLRVRLDFIPLGGTFVVGKVGQRVGTNGNYLSNGSQCMTDWMRRHAVPVVIFRDDGVEPASDPLAALRLLYARTKAPELVPPGKGLAALAEGRADREQVLKALAYAR